MKSTKDNAFITLLFTIAVYLLSLLTMRVAFAHQAGIIDSSFTVTDTTVKLTYTIPDDRLNAVVGNHPAAAFIAGGFSLKSDDLPCPAAPGTASKSLDKIASHQFFVTFQCPKTLGTVLISDYLADDNRYRNYARLSLSGMSKSVIFAPTARTHEFAVGPLLARIKASKSQKPQQAEAEALSWQNFSQSAYYLPVGMTHILTGPDHILFLLGLLLLIGSVRSLLVLITCFTLSHSIALALSVTNMVNLSPDIIEPLIALSIVYVAVENLIRLYRATPEQPVSHGRYQWLVVLLFGFVHGFGFSFLLKEMGHTNGLLPAIAFFNLGVEFGQLIIVAPLFLLLTRLARFRPSPQPMVAAIEGQSIASTAADYRQIRLKQLLSSATGLIGLYWLIQRTLLT